MDGANVGAEAIRVNLQDIDHYSQTGAKVLLMLKAANHQKAKNVILDSEPRTGKSSEK